MSMARDAFVEIPFFWKDHIFIIEFKWDVDSFGMYCHVSRFQFVFNFIFSQFSLARFFSSLFVWVVNDEFHRWKNSDESARANQIFDSTLFRQQIIIVHTAFVCRWLFVRHTPAVNFTSRNYCCRYIKNTEWNTRPNWKIHVRTDQRHTLHISLAPSPSVVRHLRCTKMYIGMHRFVCLVSVNMCVYSLHWKIFSLALQGRKRRTNCWMQQSVCFGIGTHANPYRTYVARYIY